MFSVHLKEYMLCCIKFIDSITQGYSVLADVVCLFYQFLRVTEIFEYNCGFVSVSL